VQHVVVRKQQVAQHGKQVLANARIIWSPTKATSGAFLSSIAIPPSCCTTAILETLITAQQLPDVVVWRTGIQHRQRALTPQVVQAAFAGIAELVRFGPRENLEAALRAISASMNVISRELRPISIGVDSRVMSQMSTMSAFLTPMQPSVQSPS